MKSDITAAVLNKESAFNKNIPQQKTPFSQFLFGHLNFENAINHSDKLDRESLTNILNHINFMEGHVLVKMCDPKYGESILVWAQPNPCLGEDLTCQWSSKNHPGIRLKDYIFQYIVIDDGRSLIIAECKLQDMDEEKFVARLPETSYIVNLRKMRRYKCHGIESQLTQNGFLAMGELFDFSPYGLRIRAWVDPSYSFQWFNPNEPSAVQLRDEKQVIFSGQCRCIRQVDTHQGREIVVAPINNQIIRFPKKQPRTLRQRLTPSPDLIFIHPILKRRVEFKCHDISSSGFSIYEMKDESVLIPGMIIPEMEICFAGVMRLKCTSQVIYRLTEDGKTNRCGLAILDMDINSYSRLAQVLYNTIEPNAYVSNDVDMDSLWEFFFNTGFIYPKKYRLIHSRKENFKETYRKLYQESPEIAKHFIYQENGKVYGHISMIRAYERTWMMQHYAARNMENKRTGFIVLKHIINYLNDMYRLPSAKMDYVVAYFRPQNRFPKSVFGGFAHYLNNQHGCSMDLFAYLPHTSLSLGAQLPKGWVLQKSTELDLWELMRFYNNSSGGLLLEAMGINQEKSNGKSLEAIYSRLGFLRTRYAYSLSFEGEIYAVLIVEQSDLGINLSELLSGIKVIVINPKELPWNILSIAISNLTGKYNMDKVPILFYPFDYVEANRIPFEKQYMIWVLNVQYGNEYMEYMQKKFRMNYHDP